MGHKARTHIPICEARIRRRLRPSSPAPAFLRFVRLASPLYARFAMHCTGIRMMQPERLVSVWKDFQEQRTRLMLAFRHPYGDEPQLISIAIDTLLAKEARHLGVVLPYRPHARLLHGYEVALWGDAVIRTVLPLSGALPVYHRKTDASGMKLIRSVLKDGPHPIALAPEGQVSYRSETVPRLEPGTMRMAFWCARDLKKEGRPERTLVLPISIHHRFDRRDAGKFVKLLDALAHRCGLPTHPPAVSPETPEAPAFRQAVRSRLLELELALLELAESQYGCSSSMDSADRQCRWNTVLLSALEAGERILGLPPGAQAADDVALDALIDRVYRIRHEGWERIYPTVPIEPSGTVQAAMAHRRAGEAWYAMRHMEFVDLAAYLDTAYLDAEALPDGPSYDRLVETGLNLIDLSFRLSGGNFTNRDNTLRKEAVLVIGESIDVTALLPERESEWKSAAESATQALDAAFRECILHYRDAISDRPR